MQLWKRTLSTDGKPTLEAVLPADINGDKPILFIFPGNSKEERGHRALSGFIKLVNQLANIEENITTSIVQYTSSLGKNTYNLVQSNQLLDKFTEPEAEKFANEYLIPLIERGFAEKITIFTQSYGAGFAQNVRVATINQLRERNFTDDKIGKTLEDIVLIASGNPSAAAISNIENRNSKLDYTSIFFTSPRDIMACISNKHFEKTLPENHNYLTISRLSGENRLQVTVNTPTVVIHDNNGKPAITSDPTAHFMRMFAVRGGDSSPGAVAALERALKNALARDGHIDVEALLSTKTKTTQNKQMCANGGMSIDCIDNFSITAALAKLPKKVITHDSVVKAASDENSKTLT